MEEAQLEERAASLGAAAKRELHAMRVQDKNAKTKGAGAQQPGILIPRQQMPPEAFLSIHELKAAGCPHNGLPLLIVSSPWLAPWHPDPTGFFLQQLASFLSAFIDGSGQRYGVFWCVRCATA